MATDLALTKPDPTMDEGTLRVLMAAAQRYVQSGLLPAEVNTPQKALVIMTAGRELGVPATYALRNIHVVKGKPVCAAELLLALVRRSYGPGAMRVGKTSNTACTVQYREQGWDGISEYTFTIEDAQRAGVANGSSWKSYPAAMLRARCISAVVRFAFPECIAGLYTPEEMGAEVVVTDEGHVQVVDTTPFVEGPCDKAAYLAEWHSMVRGTRFEHEQDRHLFMAKHTKNETASLANFLDTATEEQAAALIEDIAGRMQAEATYKRLRGEAIKADHPQHQKLKDTLTSSLSDDVLAASIASLEKYLADLEPAF